MRLTENQIRKIIQEEILREGFFVDVMGKFRGMLGSGEGEQDETFGLEAAIPSTRALAAFGLTPRHVARWVEGKSGPNLETRTSPAYFYFTKSGLDSYSFNHPTGDPKEATDLGLDRYIGRSMLVDIPEKSKAVFSYPPGVAGEQKKLSLVGAKNVVGGATPSDRELDYVSRMGGDPSGWQTATRGMDPESRLGMLIKLCDALTVSRLIKKAYEMSINCWGDELTARLFRPR